MKRAILILMFGFAFQLAGAEGEKDTTRVANRLNYFFYMQTGPLVRVGGQQVSPMTFAVSMVHGIRIYDKYNLGLGIGVDYYETRRVVPLFVSVAADLAGKINKLFVEMDYGGSFPKLLTDVYGVTDSKPGYFINPNLGYSVRLERLTVSFIAGYKFQRVTDYYAYPYYFYDNYTLTSGENATIIQMDLSRLVLGIRVGLR